MCKAKRSGKRGVIGSVLGARHGERRDEMVWYMPWSNVGVRLILAFLSLYVVLWAGERYRRDSAAGFVLARIHPMEGDGSRRHSADPVYQYCRGRACFGQLQAEEGNPAASGAPHWRLRLPELPEPGNGFAPGNPGNDRIGSLSILQLIM